MTATGTLRLEGRPVGGQDVLAFDTVGEHPALLAAAVTDDEGRFALDAPPGAALLGRLRGETIAIAAGEAGDDLDVPGPPARVTMTVDGDAERLHVYFDPVAIAGVPHALTPFASQQSAGVFDAHFAQRTVSGGELEVALAPGTWRVSGDFIIHERPMTIEPDYANYVVDRVLGPDGNELARAGSGFELVVDGDVRLTLVLRELADSEL